MSLISSTSYDYNLSIIKSPKPALNAQAHPRGTSWSVLLKVSYHKEYNHIWFRGGDLNSFQYIKPLMKWTGRGILQGTSWSVPLNASCRKKHVYVWFRGGDLNEASYEVNGVGHAQEDFPVSDVECILS